MRKAVISSLILAVLFSYSLVAKTSQNSFNGGIGTVSPCTGEPLSLSGVVDLHASINGDHVAIHLTFKGSGSNADGDYRTSFIANGQFEGAGPYDVSYHAVAVGKGKAPNFSYSGVVRVFVNNAGVPVGAAIQSLSSSCTN